jgi:hypothetical protein
MRIAIASAFLLTLTSAMARADGNDPATAEAIPPAVVMTLSPRPAFLEKRSDGSTQRTVAFILGGVGVASVPAWIAGRF